MDIRPAQLAAFERQRQEDFSKKVCADLRTHRADVVGDLSDQQLKSRVDNGIRRAREHGMTKLYSIAMFVELMFLVAPNFDEYPAVSYVFGSSRYAPDDKIDLIIAAMNEQKWHEAKQQANPAAWVS